MLTRFERFKIWAGFDSTYRRFGRVTLRGPKRLLDQVDLIEMTTPVRAPDDSRLAGGVLLIPDDIRRDDGDIDHSDDEFMRELYEAMRKPLDRNTRGRCNAIGSVKRAILKAMQS